MPDYTLYINSEFYKHLNKHNNAFDKRAKIYVTSRIEGFNDKFTCFVKLTYIISLKFTFLPK